MKKRDYQSPLHFSWATLIVVLGVCFVGVPSHAQNFNATLYGTVTDSAGAAIADAYVTATDVATSFTTKTTTDDTGNYTFPRLSPAVYSIAVEKVGFTSKVLTGISLQVDQKARIDVELKVGSVASVVEVTGAAPLVDSKSASLGTVIAQREVVDLPLNIRRFGNLAVLVPGTTTDNGGFAANAFGSPFSENTYSANGVRTASNNTMIDGVDSRNMTTGGFAVQPSPDAVQEFKIQTNIYDAAFGKTAGSTINLITKSGTNEYHGSLYEFWRNDAIDAKNYFTSTRKPELRRNQFGGAIGGPIIKDKLFFFGNYEGLRLIQGAVANSNVPTPAQLGGDLSSVLTGVANANPCGAGGPASLNYDPGQLFYPGTETVTTCSSGANAGKQVLVGTPIPGNIIPAASIDPVMAKVIPYFPAPNRSGSPNFVNLEPNIRNDHQVDARIDYNLGPKDQVFGRYILGQSTSQGPGNGYTSLPGFDNNLKFRGQNLALSWTHAFGSNLLNEAIFGFQRDTSISTCVKCPYPPGFTASFGINGLAAPQHDQEAIPFFGMNNFAGVGDGLYIPLDSPDMVEKYQDTVTWIHGRHTVVVGADIQPWQILHTEAPFAPHGVIYYSGQYAGLNGELGSASAGVSDLADFLLGYPDYAGRTLRFRPTYEVGGSFINTFGQDNINLTRNLSVNLGVRWEYRRPPIDKFGNLVSFVPTGAPFSGTGNGILVTAATNALNDSFCTDPAYAYLTSSSGKCLVATSAQRAQLGFTGRTAQTLIFDRKTDFAPRVGISWRPLNSNRLIVHTGYGIFYDLPNMNNQHFVNNNPIFSPSEQISTNAGEPPPANTENIFGPAGIPPLNQQYISLYVQPHYRTPYIQEWSFGLQTQLAADWALETDYVGTKGSHLDNLHLDGNQAAPGITPQQSRRPYPDFGTMLFSSSNGTSNYNALQTKLTKRFTHGLTFITAYTYAKSIDNGEGDEGFAAGGGNVPQDDNNQAVERGRSYNDARHRVVVSTIWELPFGKGKNFLNQGGVLNAIVGGWEVSDITSYQSGFPFTVTSQDFSGTSSGDPRPDRTCSGIGKKTVSSWFNTSCFTTSALQAAFVAGHPRFGNSGRNILDGPGLFNSDIAMLKRFQAGERVKFEFRTEFFNAFNHPHFGLPGTRLGSPSFGIIQSAAEGRDIQLGLKMIY